MFIWRAMSFRRGIGPRRHPAILGTSPIPGTATVLTTAASILLQEGGAAVAILMDGFEGWSALGLPFHVALRHASAAQVPLLRSQLQRPIRFRAMSGHVV